MLSNISRIFSMASQLIDIKFSKSHVEVLSIVYSRTVVFCLSHHPNVMLLTEKWCTEGIKGIHKYYIIGMMFCFYKSKTQIEYLRCLP